MQRSIRSPAGSHCHSCSMSTSPRSASQKQESTSEAAQITCPRRHVDGITRIERANGEKFNMMAANSCILGGFMCVLPFALDTWKDVRHHRHIMGLCSPWYTPTIRCSFIESISKFVLLIAGTYPGVGNVNLMGWTLVQILTSFIIVLQRFSRPQATCCHTLIA
jgi:LITAF-like zinc ribbon domain